MPRPTTDSTIKDGDWSGEDVSDEIHERVLFQDPDFSEATGHCTQFTDCTFRSGTFDAARFSDGAFENCTFVRCSFFGTEFTECKFIGTVFNDCDLAQLRVTGGNWSFVGLPAADLRRASFDGARMREVDLTGALCAGGVLTNCDLSGASWDRADVSRCDLRGSDLSSLMPLGVRLRGAIVGWEQAMAVAINLGLDVRPD